mmetsp:Transcript_13955/g.32763  ORF Transcript_13955/g.32763 Transcript_13955/m.32763 type:complete len:854 (-) Transcript_13955:127-2688(-)|eukprot:CAMPEP_0171093294 /NCGR_PEP_ID=MMETSP0766_2-20121228/38992_1 /TAXON_ID=439317 /ORGANISM="Gambierdiscus australes, Strain CAWD 149" /LENGTH=853 /DNA_ID=CAMNT_0011551717 /DNA_START=65 /DNA_END=2626 /DNA_ORIENTATION=-
MPAQDLKKGVDLRTAADKLLETGEFEEAFEKAKEAAELLEDGGEEEVAVLATLAAVYLVRGQPKMAMEKAKQADVLGETLGGAAKQASMLSLVKTYMGYRLVPAALLSVDTVMLPLRSAAGTEVAPSLIAAVKSMPMIDFMAPSVDTSLMADALDDAAKVAASALTLFKGAGNKKGEATALYLQTYVKSEKRVLRDALPQLEEVAKMFKEAGATKEEELVLKDILSYYVGKSDSDGTSKLKSQVQEKGSAALLRVVADTFFNLKEYDEANRLAMEALSAFRSQGDKAGEVAALRAVMNVHISKSEWDDALQQADQLASKLDDKKHKAGAMYMVVSIQLQREDGYGEAVTALGKVRTLYKEAGDASSEAEALIATAETHLANADPEAGLKSAQDAVAVCKAAGLGTMEGMALLSVVRSSLEKGDEPGAQKAVADALSKYKDASDATGQASALLLQAEMQLNKGNAQQAMDLAHDALMLAVGNTRQEAAAKFTLAQAMMGIESSEGLRMGKEALTLFEQAGDVANTAATLYMLATGYFSKYELEEGLKCAREALAIYRSLGDVQSEETLKQIIEEARGLTAEIRKQQPKKPMTIPSGSGPAPPTGPAACPVTEARVPQEVLEPAVAARKYWGVPKMVQPDPSLDVAERSPSHAIVFGQNLSDNIATQVCVEFGDLVATMAKGDVAKIPIIVTTCGVNGRMTGEHVPTHMTGVSAVTIWGMVRTVRQEIPQVNCHLLDFSAAQTTAQIPRNLRQPQGVLESAYYLGARFEPQLAQVPSLFRRELKRDNLTGGGGGGSNMGEPKKAAKFMRRSFNWTGPTHKLDYAWYRQEWRAVAAAVGDIGPMPPQQPCRAMRSI